jgi:hypothetical protein
VAQVLAALRGLRFVAASAHPWAARHLSGAEPPTIVTEAAGEN